MRKLLLIAFLALSTTAAYAVPVECLAVLGVSPTLQSLINTNAGGGCFHQDKIFSNFVYSGAGAAQQPASAVSATHQFQLLASQDLHGFLISPISGQWTTAFTFGFTATVCTTAAQGCETFDPNARIVLTTQQTNSGVRPNNSVVTTNWTPNTGAPFVTTTTGVSPATETTQCPSGFTGCSTSAPLSATQITALANYNPNGGTTGIPGQLQSLELDVVESSAIPEPATMALIGSGLLLVGFGRRRFRS